VIVVTWNIGRRTRPGHARFLEGLRADVVALQEVSPGHVPLLRRDLAEIGLPHVIVGAEFGRRFPFQQMVASRWPLDRRDAATLDIPHRERILVVVVHAPAGQVELVNVHVPAATSSGVATKVATFEGLSRYLSQPADLPRIVCGDFNTPKSETSGSVQYWGSAHQQRAERHVIEHAGGGALPDVYRLLNGADARAESWRAHNGTGRRYDHVFASPVLDAREAGYGDLDVIKGLGLSDHAPLRVVFGVPAASAAPPEAPAIVEDAWPVLRPESPTTSAAYTPTPARARPIPDVRGFVKSLSYLRDVRRDPNEPRRRQFRTGWRHAVDGGRYTALALQQLTWNNLGYRAGLTFGAAPDAAIERAYDGFVAEFEAAAERRRVADAPS
jgi:endonuclease/exonuclease/phosphatase family metal-dependent hydrolase